MSEVTLYHGDCLEELSKIPSSTVDCIIDDLPYGVVNRSSEAGKWDIVIPFEPLWEQFLRVTKPNAPIILFGQGMFTAELMFSQKRLWRYNLVWDKCRSTGFLNANRMPLRRHEDICVFYRTLPKYTPQLVRAERGCESHTKGKAQFSNGSELTNNCYGKFHGVKDSDSTKKWPGSILRFPKPHNKGNHPTEKPVDLMRWLIRGYTTKGDTIMDATMGSGTTGIAAVLEDRNFIGIEKTSHWFAVAKDRIHNVQTAPRQWEFQW